jgi:hypothetical protein
MDLRSAVAPVVEEVPVLKPGVERLLVVVLGWLAAALGYAVLGR